MPHFTVQIDPQGPLLTIYIGVSQAKRTALQIAKQPIPAQVPVRALVDTGASSTCVDPKILQKLSLTPTGKATVNTSSTGTNPHVADQYDVSILISGIPRPPMPAWPLVMPTLPVICMELFESAGVDALIGRDILAMCILTYNGDTGQFTLAF